MNNKVIIFFVEGETEKALIEALPLLGKVIKCNLWDNDVTSQLRKLKKGSLVYVVYDTDILTSFTVQRFLNNLKCLEKNNFLGGLIQQTENLEDELVYACNQFRHKRDLFDAFEAQNAKEFKSKFLATTNLLSKLENHGFDAQRLWGQQPTLSHFNSYHKHRKYCRDLNKR